MDGEFPVSTYGYSSPDTSDKRDDECWVEYWDRKRHERHGENCGCALCYNEDIMPADHTWCKHTYQEDDDASTADPPRC
jgi:hypothetical protein